MAIAPSAAANSQVICSYAPSQSSVVSHLAAFTGGSAVAASAIAQATGLSAVLHSSGVYIFTGTAGYVAGTIGSAAALPAIVTVGVVVAGSAVTLELVCAARNHPEQVEKVQAAASEFMRRSQRTIATASRQVTIEARDVVATVSADAFEQANRVSVEWADAIRARLK